MNIMFIKHSMQFVTRRLEFHRKCFNGFRIIMTNGLQYQHQVRIKPVSWLMCTIFSWFLKPACFWDTLCGFADYHYSMPGAFGWKQTELQPMISDEGYSCSDDAMDADDHDDGPELIPSSGSYDYQRQILFYSNFDSVTGRSLQRPKVTC